MRVEEIAIRQEVRQMISEAGYDRSKIGEETKKIIREEVQKRLDHIDIYHLATEMLSSFEFRNEIKRALQVALTDNIKVSVVVEVPENEKPVKGED